MKIILFSLGLLLALIINVKSVSLRKTGSLQDSFGPTTVNNNGDDQRGSTFNDYNLSGDRGFVSANPGGAFASLPGILSGPTEISGSDPRGGGVSKSSGPTAINNNGDDQSGSTFNDYNLSGDRGFVSANPGGAFASPPAIL